MAQVITDRRDLDFVLYEQFHVEEFTRHEKFQDYNKKTFELIIKEARNLAVKEILPTYAEGDREGVKFDRGRVSVPACYHRPYQLLREGEWTAMIADPDLGGQGLPRCIAQAASEYMVGANYALTLYGLSGACGRGAGRVFRYR